MIAAAPDSCTLHELKVKGATRTYWLHRPVQKIVSRFTGQAIEDSDHRKAKHPLILVLHGALMTSKRMIEFSALTELADAHDCLLVYPDMSYFWHWDVPEGFSNKDADFLEHLIAKLIQTEAVDANRVYATGFSSGADILHLLACNQKTAALISAFAPVCSNLDRQWAQKIEHDSPTSILMINGTDDKFNRWEGDKRWMSVADTFSYWQRHNRIGLDGEQTLLPGTTLPGAKSKAETTEAHLVQTFDRESGSEVSLFKIDGGGHMWPSAKQENWFLRFLLGRKHNEHLASSVIWSFFARHPGKRMRGETTIAPQAVRAK